MSVGNKDQGKLLPEEQPPGKDKPLREWLSRLVILMNGALDNATNIPLIGKLPTYIANGFTKYFNVAIPPTIDYPGPWTVVDGIWQPLIGVINAGEYISGAEYYPQQTVTNVGWTMSCINRTFDPPAPQPIGPPVYGILIPAHLQAENERFVQIQNTYVMEKNGWITFARFLLASTVLANQVYLRISDSNGDMIYSNSGAIPPTFPMPGPYIVNVNKIVQAGNIVEIGIISTNVSDKYQSLSGAWAFESATTAPSVGSGEWNHDIPNTTIRFHEIDNNLVDQSVPLSDIQIGDEITIKQGMATHTYTVTSLSSLALNVYSMSATLGSSIGTLIDGDPCLVSAFRLGTPNAVYLEDEDYWLSDQPSFASASGAITTQLGTTINDTAYSADIEFQEFVLSDDWRFLAYNPEIVLPLVNP